MGLRPTKGNEDADVAQALLACRAETRLGVLADMRQECRCSTQECVRHEASSTE